MAQYPSEFLNLGQSPADPSQVEFGDLSFFTDSHVTTGMSANEAFLKPWPFAFDTTFFNSQLAQQRPGLGVVSPNANAWMAVSGTGGPIFGDAPVMSLGTPAGEPVEPSTISATPATALRTTPGSHDAPRNEGFHLARRAVGYPTYRCACGATFARLDALNRHRNRTPKFECPECKNHDGAKAFKRRDHLMQHLRTYHRLDNKGMARHIIRQRRH